MKNALGCRSNKEGDAEARREVTVEVVDFCCGFAMENVAGLRKKTIAKDREAGIANQGAKTTMDRFLTSLERHKPPQLERLA